MYEKIIGLRLIDREVSELRLGEFSRVAYVREILTALLNDEVQDSGNRSVRRTEMLKGVGREKFHMPGLSTPWPKVHANEAAPTPRITFASK